MASVELVDRAGPRARKPSARVPANLNTAPIMDMAGLTDCLTYLSELFESKARESAISAGFPEGRVPDSYRRISREISEVGMPTAHLINRGVTHADWVRNQKIAIHEILKMVRNSQYNGRWALDGISFWKNVRTVNHDAPSSGADAEARAALLGFSVRGAATVEQINITDSGVTGVSATRDERDTNNKSDMDVIGITVTFVDLENAANIRREKGEVISGGDLARDNHLAQITTGLGTAVEKLAATLSSSPTPAADEAERPIHHKTQSAIDRMKGEKDRAMEEAAKAITEKNAAAEENAALKRQIEMLTAQKK
jgi:hypothetical protein